MNYKDYKNFVQTKKIRSLILGYILKRVFMKKNISKTKNNYRILKMILFVYYIYFILKR